MKKEIFWTVTYFSQYLLMLNTTYLLNLQIGFLHVPDGVLNVLPDEIGGRLLVVSERIVLYFQEKFLEFFQCHGLSIRARHGPFEIVSVGRCHELLIEPRKVVETELVPASTVHFVEGFVQFGGGYFAVHFWQE